MPTHVNQRARTARPQPAGPPPAEFGAATAAAQQVRGSPGHVLPGAHPHGVAAEPPAQARQLPTAPRPGDGRSPTAAGPCTSSPGLEYQATTTQLCGLFPFVAGSGTPAAGTPVGRHQLWGEVVCLDPLAWLRAGLVTNPGVFVLGQPGTGKSALVKRLVTGAVAFGTKVLILGDTKPDYTPLVRHLGGQVIRIGRGLDRINPLDAGPLGAALRADDRPARAAAAVGGPVPAAVAADGPGHPDPRRAGSPTPRKSSSAAPSTCSTSAAAARPSPPSPTCWP